MILEKHESLLANLESYYCLLRKSVHTYAQLSELHQSLTPTDIAYVLKVIGRQGTKMLSSQQIDTCVSMLNWLDEKQYNEPHIPMLCEYCTRVQVGKCV